MTVLSYAQLEGLWLKASQGTKYHSRTWAALMAAIAEAESGGNTDALNPSDNHGTQSSFGLWQISNGTHAAPSPNWADPSENARLAIGKLQGQGLGAWGTYTSGAYKAYLSSKTAPDPNVPGNPSATSAELTAAAAKDCLIAAPSWHVDVFLGLGPSGGGGCIFTKSNARAFLGAGFMAAGLFIGMSGIIGIGLSAGFAAASAASRELGKVPLAGQYLTGRGLAAGLRRPAPPPARRAPRREETVVYEARVVPPERRTPPRRPVGPRRPGEIES